jgi:ComF family protein
LKRKYNQSELLAQELSKLTGISNEPRALQKIKNTRQQEGLSARSRRVNVVGSFGIDERHRHLIADKNILLVDDVITTGSTVNECAKVLKMHEARKVIVVTIARVVAPMKKTI